MTVPVAWVTYHDKAIARGYWDQAFLEDLLSRELWRPYRPVRFEHVERIPCAQVAEAGGAVVVLPARHHAAPEHVERLNAEISVLDWVLLVLTGDEESAFPWRDVTHPNLRLWVMTPRPGVHDELDPPRFLGSGYQTGTRLALAELAYPYPVGSVAPWKSLDWFFAGQVTHERREECAAALREMYGGVLVGTEGFTQGLPQAEYLADLARARFAPCPAGPCSPDSFRVEEALEAGALPILDTHAPDGLRGYWEMLYPGAAFPQINDWSTLPLVLDWLKGDWPRVSNKAQAWWQTHKRELAYQFDDDIRVLAPDVEEGYDPTADEITVLIPTSPIPSHPSTAIIEATIQSVRDRLPDAEIVVMIDGLRPQQEDRREAYDEYVRRLLWLTNHRWPNVLPVLFDEHLHQAEMTRRALDSVRTRTVLFVEHDTPLEGDTPFESLVVPILDGGAHVVRLLHEAAILPDHEHLMLDGGESRLFGGLNGDEVPLVRTLQWSQRPHLASTAFYRAMLDRWFPTDSRTMIEDRIYGIVQDEWYIHGDAGWDEFRLWIYAPEGNMKRSTNLDGRGDDPKYEMHFGTDPRRAT